MKELLLVLAAVLVASAAQAQGSITGCAVDDYGSSLPGVTITVTGPPGHGTAVTDGHGCYEVRSLKAGSYTLIAVPAGFRTFTRDNIRVTDARVPLALRQSTIVFQQEQWVSEPSPYPVGQDLVVFLTLSHGTFYRTSGWFGAFLVRDAHIETINRNAATPGMTVEDFLAKLRAFGGAGVAGPSPQQGKPTHQIIANTEFSEPPPSLREMVQAADAVVFGRILEGASKDGGFYHKTDPGIVTFYPFRVTEVLRWPSNRPLPESDLTIVRDGGAIDRGLRIEKLEVDEFPQFSVGHQYVLFLRWHGEHDAWTPAWGPHGTFEVNEGGIHSIGSARIAKAQDGLSVDRFLAKLRAVAKEVER